MDQPDRQAGGRALGAIVDRGALDHEDQDEREDDLGEERGSGAHAFSGLGDGRGDVAVGEHRVHGEHAQQGADHLRRDVRGRRECGENGRWRRGRW
jgi:hypothetical protein